MVIAQVGSLRVLNCSTIKDIATSTVHFFSLMFPIEKKLWSIKNYVVISYLLTEGWFRTSARAVRYGSSISILKAIYCNHVYNNHMLILITIYSLT